MRKKELEIRLQSLSPMPLKSATLEQYDTPAGIASEILYFAHSLNDVEGKDVVDLGCGAGIFAIGAKLLGASRVLGLDIDEKAVDVARQNASKVGVEIEFVQGDVSSFQGRFDTVFQNPPFGSQTRHADIPFLEKALEVGTVVYTIHNAETTWFLERMVASLGGSITHKLPYRMPIPHSFPFHRREVVDVDVILLRVVSGEELKK